MIGRRDETVMQSSYALFRGRVARESEGREFILLCLLLYSSRKPFLTSMKGVIAMFQRILVPLDGSSRAEQALPVAARIARASGATIVLLRAIPLPNEFVA